MHLPNFLKSCSLPSSLADLRQTSGFKLSSILDTVTNVNVVVTNDDFPASDDTSWDQTSFDDIKEETDCQQPQQQLALSCSFNGISLLR